MQKADFLGKTLMLGKREVRDGEGQGSLGYCSPWGRKKLDTIEQLNNNNKTSQVKELSAFLCVGRVWVH